MKAMRAALNAEKYFPMRVRGIEVNDGQDGGSFEPGDIWVMRGVKYTSEIHRLGMGSCHALFVCQKAGFLVNNDDETLWAELKNERFTTPLLRGWLPYLREELKARGLLRHCYTLDCDCMMLTAKTKDLDEIVTEGLTTGRISIREE